MSLHWCHRHRRHLSTIRCVLKNVCATKIFKPHYKAAALSSDMWVWHTWKVGNQRSTGTCRDVCQLFGWLCGNAAEAVNGFYPKWSADFSLFCLSYWEVFELVSRRVINQMQQRGTRKIFYKESRHEDDKIANRVFSPYNHIAFLFPFLHAAAPSI